MVRLSDVLRPMRLPADVVVTSRKTFDDWCRTPGTLMFEAATKGEVLHAGL